MQFEEELNKALQEQHEQFQAKRKKFTAVNEKLAKQAAQMNDTNAELRKENARLRQLTQGSDHAKQHPSNSVTRLATHTLIRVIFVVRCLTFFCRS